MKHYTNKPQNEVENKPKMPAKKKVALIAGIVLGIILIVGVSVYAIFQHYYSKMDYQKLKEEYSIAESIPEDKDVNLEESNSPEGEISALGDYLKNNLEQNAQELDFDNENVYNVLLIGTDNRAVGASARSDSMIIVSINQETKQIVMTSIMRDTFVSIPGVGNNRINAAYAYGGVELLLDTIKENFKIDIDQYAVVDFYGFMGVVDAVGGVNVDVSADEIEVMQNYIREINKLEGKDENESMLSPSDAGKILLNGKQSLAYSRVRYVGNADFERTQRQRTVLTGVFSKMTSLNLQQLNDLTDILFPEITTNVTQGEIFSLILKAAEYMNYEIVSCRMPTDSTFNYLRVDGMSVLGIDFAKNREYWYNAAYKGIVEE